MVYNKPIEQSRMYSEQDEEKWLNMKSQKYNFNL